MWIVIMLFFSKYANDNAEQLREAFVHHEGKMNLVVHTLVEDESDWDDFFEGIIRAIRDKTVKGVTENLECDFTSTDQFSTVLSTAIVMNTLKNYFNYLILRGGCGIVNIHMGGTLEDWEKLEKKLSYLRQFDVNGKLKSYVDRLLPVLEQFTETYKGHPHIEFWNNLYHERIHPQSSFYAPLNRFNGWLIRFFTLKD
jgi:hypothetical protein